MPVTAKASTTKHHHLDRRAGRLMDDPGADDDLLNTREVADWLGVSTQWVEIGRSKNYGPEFVRIGPRVISYRRGDVLKWLKACTHASTAEYSSRKETAA